MVETVLTEAYTANEIEKVLWNVFKTRANSIKLVHSDDEKLTFSIVPNDMSVEEANNIMGELFDTELFDVEYIDQTRTIKIDFFQHGVENTLKESLNPNGKYAYKVLRVIGRHHGINIDGIDPNKLIEKYNENIQNKPDTGKEAALALETAVKQITEDSQDDFNYGTTRFGKPGDGKDNVDAIAPPTGDTHYKHQVFNEAGDEEETEEQPGEEKSNDELNIIEKLAAAEHEQWIEWATSLMKSEPKISPQRIERWRTMMGPYETLPNEVKEQDRVYARKVLDIFKEYLKSRIEKKNEGSSEEVPEVNPEPTPQA